MSYIDPDGEWFWLIPMLIGGVINWVTNGADFTREGLSYFGVGALGGLAILVPVVGVPLAGAITGAGNNFVGQGFAGGNGNTWNGSNLDWGQIGISGATGALTAYVGGQMAGKIAPHVSKYVSDVIKSPVIQDMLTNGITSGATGFALGAGMTALNGGSFKESMQAGWNSAKVGLAAGGATGALSGFQRAKAEGVHWLTGEKLTQKTNATVGGIPNDWIQKPSDKGGGVVYQDPNNPHNSIRIMPGNPNSPNPAQQNPYVIYRYNGISYDANGFPLPNGNLPNSHIPLNLFDINKMPR